MKTTQYFEHIRRRPDRACIRDEWIEQVIQNPLRGECNNVVSITIEHASKASDMREFLYQRIPAPMPS